MPFFSTFSGSFTAGRRRMHGNQQTFPSLNWSPADEDNLAFWVDASDTSSYTANGAYLKTITDKAGNATITVHGGDPTIDTQNPVIRSGSGQLNGKNIIEFSGNQDQSLTTNEFLQAASGNHWAVGLFQWTSINNSKDSFWSVENNTVNATTSKRDYAVSSNYPSNIFFGELDLDGMTTNRISSTAGNRIEWTWVGSNTDRMSNYTWHIISVIFNKAGNQIACRVNGENMFTPVNDYDNSLTPNLDVRIFRNRGSEYMAGKLAEFFTVADIPGTTVSNTDISNVEKAEGYLAHKWSDSSSTAKNILGRLDANHPYKNQAPAGSGGSSSTTTSIDTFMGLEFDTYSGAFGDIYGIYNNGTNVGSTRGTGFPSTSFYTTTQALGEKGTCGGSSADFPRITAAGQPVGQTWHAYHFKGANNGQYSTSYPSPNRLICTFSEASNGQSLASAGYIGDEWTIEMWFYPDSSPAYTQEANKHQVLFDGRSNATGGADNPVILLRADGMIRMGSGNQGANIIHSTHPLESSTGAVSFDSWHHLAVTKTAGTGANNISIFVDGTEVGGGIANTTVNPGFYDPSFSTFYLGDDYYGENGNGRLGFSGGIHNVRVSKGKRYTSNFTPPHTPLS